MADDRLVLPGGRTLVLVGDSHTVALGVPTTRSGRLDLVRIPGRPDNVYAVEGGLPRDGAYWKYVAEIAPSRTIVISWLGNQHAEFLFRAVPEFDFYVEMASTYSKSVLRVAAQQACQAHADVCYFPAYEIITGPQAPASFFEADFRNVSAAGVECVMSALLSHCDVGSGAAAPAARPSAATPLQQLGTAIAKLECEEQAMDGGPT